MLWNTKEGEDEWKNGTTNKLQFSSQFLLLTRKISTLEKKTYTAALFNSAAARCSIRNGLNNVFELKLWPNKKNLDNILALLVSTPNPSIHSCNVFYLKKRASETNERKQKG